MTELESALESALEPAVSKPNKPFILLLHGLGATPITLIGVEKYLNYQGLDRTHKLSYPVDKLPLNECLDWVDQALSKVVPKTDSIVIIGQSMGGVIGSRLHEKGWQIEKLITIGSPLKGASLVKSLKAQLPQKLQDLMYKPMYDDLITMIENPLAVPPHKYHCITMSWPLLSTFDGCVYEAEARFDNIHHTHLSFTDHRTVFADPRLWHLVHELIIKEISKEIDSGNN